MRRIDKSAYDRLTKDAAVLAADDHGPKVLRLADGRGLKLFRRKRRLSSNGLRPYAQRFAHAARKLTQRGIPTVAVDEVFRVPALERDVVVYQYLAGSTLRDALQHGDTATLMEGFARFLAELHAKGVYFRGLHFGNVVITPANDWGLIDISEARFRPWPLRVGMRARNFKPLLRYREDAAAVEAFGFARFVERYAHHAALSPRRVACLRRRLAALDGRFANPA